MFNLKKLRRRARARLVRAVRRIGRAAGLLPALPGRLRDAATQHRMLLALSRSGFVAIMVLLVVCTAIDVLKQSFSTGQFWDSIIVLSVIAAIILYTLVLVLLRKVNTTRWLASIPRRSQVGRSDVGSKMIAKISAARIHCRMLFRNQLDFATVEHLGAQNPLRRGRGEQDIEVPFWEIADTIPKYVESNVTIVLPELSMHAGQSLREYLELAVDEQLFDAHAMTHELRSFIEMYERMRYGGQPVSYRDLLRMMTALVALNNEMGQAGPIGSYAASSELGSLDSVMVHDSASEASVIRYDPSLASSDMSQ